MTRNFMEMLKAKWDEGKFVCVGLDSDLEKIPPTVKKSTSCGIISAFNRAIVEATSDLVCAYKPNVAFYEAQGSTGIDALHHTIVDIHILAPNVPVILDAKRADIDSTNAGYAKMAFGFLQADAITVHPYLGGKALRPFLDQKDKGIIVICRTSNPGADEFQNLFTPRCREKLREVEERRGRKMFFAIGAPLYQYVAYQVATNWNQNGNCAVVVGATHPDGLRQVREIVGDMPILIPGIGAQGGDVEATVKAGMDSKKQGMIINSSRGIIFASQGEDFAEAARRETQKLHNMINQSRT